MQNTYLATFQSLGGLGLLLGTIGLAVVQWRNVLERRGELALLRAAGFPARMLAILVALENVLLLVLGLGVGLLAALVAVLPHLIGRGAAVPLDLGRHLPPGPRRRPRRQSGAYAAYCGRRSWRRCGKSDRPII